MATFNFRVRTTINKPVTIELVFCNGRNTHLSLRTGLLIVPNQWDKESGLPFDNTQNKNIRDNLIKLKKFLFESFNKAQTKGIAMDTKWLQAKVDECFKRNKKNTMQQFIVAEISKSWEGNFDENTPLSELIARKFEAIINTNYTRGYRLYDWRFSTSIDEKGILNETIIAVFELDPRIPVIPVEHQ